MTPTTITTTTNTATKTNTKTDKLNKHKETNKQTKLFARRRWRCCQGPSESRFCAQWFQCYKAH
jgi:hypothetical protein